MAVGDHCHPGMADPAAGGGGMKRHLVGSLAMAAWLLWGTAWDEHPPQTQWKPEQSFATLAECRAAKDQADRAQLRLEVFSEGRLVHQKPAAWRCLRQGERP